MRKITRDLVVLGGGPGGYTAAFRAADLGRSVTLIDKNPTLGGVCLNVGCIPSKTLLHISGVLKQTELLKSIGVEFSAPTIDLARIRSHKEQVVTSLTSGLDKLCEARSVERVTGSGTFTSDNSLLVTTPEEDLEISFTDCIIAVGSRPNKIPEVDHTDPRIWDSTDALALKSIPNRLTIIGGGIIGLEIAEIYHSLGSEITMIEMMKELIPAADKDLKRPLVIATKKTFSGVYTSTKVTKIVTSGNEVILSLEGKKAPETLLADAVLIAVGRRPNTDLIGIEHTSIKLDQRSFITTDTRQVAYPHLFAIGDIVGNPMLAHKATHQGKVAAEVACEQASAFTPTAIPSVAYTSPEIAWVGLTEKEAKEQGIEYEKGSFPWRASGRALSEQAIEGMSKVLFDKNHGRILGAGITGAHAGELISEAVLAIEMGAVAEDIAKTIHPHPTLSETFGLSSEIVDGSITDILPKK